MARRHEDFIGVFDSGAGGLSVLSKLSLELPNEDFVFYGDSAHAPYGEKSREWVIRRSRAITEELLNRGAKAIVIACNTATSAAAATLRADYAHVPIIGVEPALKPATQAEGVERILVMATSITLRLDKYQQLAKRWGGGHEVIGVECSGLAERVEQGNLDAPDVVELLESLIGAYRGEVDAVVLGCTHYPFVSSAIRTVVGEVPLFDGARGTARQLGRVLQERSLLTSSPKSGELEFLSSSKDASTIARYRELYELARKIL